MDFGHNDHFKIYVNHKNLRQPWDLSPFLQNGLVYLAEIWSISGTLVLTDMKMKKICNRISDRLKIYINPSKIYVHPGV